MMTERLKTFHGGDLFAWITFHQKGVDETLSTQIMTKEESDETLSMQINTKEESDETLSMQINTKENRKTG